MISLIDFFNLYIIGTAETIILFYFFMKFIDKKAKIYHYFLFAIASNLILNLMPANVLLKFVLYIIMLIFWGVFIFKANRKMSVLYAVITFDIMQLCYGILNSLIGILSQMILTAHNQIFNLHLMAASSFIALSLSCFCYRIIYKYFKYSEKEKNQYVLMILTPLLMIFLSSEYINSTIYSNTISLSDNGYIFNTNHIQMLIIQIFSILSLFCILYAYKKLVDSFKISTELAMLEQERYYQNQYVSEAKSRYEKTLSFRHDVKNHLSIIYGLLEKGNTIEVSEYLKNIEELTTDYSFPCHTNNPVLDILIGNKLGLAKSNGITASCSLEFPYPCLIADMDFCIILSNALDNAISACGKIEESSEKYIQISGHRQGDFFLIEIKNSYRGKPYYKKGMGLSNIKAITQKYNGAMNINKQNGDFCLSVMLVIPQQSEYISHQVDSNISCKI